MTTSLEAIPDNSSSRLWLGAVVCFAFIVRCGVLVLMPEGLNRDTDAYRKIAETLRSSGTFGFPMPAMKATGRADRPARVEETDVRPTAFRPPLYPLLLAVLVTDGQLRPAAVGAFHLVCGLLTVLLVWILGRQWGLRRSAAIAALLTTCDPILLHQSTQLMTETLAALLAVLAMCGLTKWMRRPRTTNALQAGLLLGVACLCRPTFLPWSGLIVATFLIIKIAGTARWSAAVALLTGILIALLPWGLRNYLQFGQVKFSTTHGGYTLLLGNNPSFYQFLREGRRGSVWESRELDQAWLRRLELRHAADDLFAPTKLSPPDQSPGGSRPNFASTEFVDDRLAYEVARRHIREDWRTFVYSCLHRVGSLWHLLPHRIRETESISSFVLRWGTAFWYLFVFGFAIVGGWRLRSRLLCIPWLWGVLLCLAFTAVHAVYWSNLRMRAPLMPFISLMAAAGMTACCRFDCVMGGSKLEGKMN